MYKFTVRYNFGLNPHPNNEIKPLEIAEIDSQFILQKNNDVAGLVKIVEEKETSF